MNVLADTLDQQFARGEMDFADGRHPEFVAEARLFENQRRTFVNARQKSAADGEGVAKRGFETGDSSVVS